MWLNWHFSYHLSSQFSDIKEVYHDAVLATVCLISLEAYEFMCHSRAEYYISAVYVKVIPHTMYFPPLVLFVRLQRWWHQCQPYLTTVCISGMLLFVIMYCVSVLMCIGNTDFHFYSCWELNFDIHQHHWIMTMFIIIIYFIWSKYLPINCLVLIILELVAWANSGLVIYFRNI
jgi:hypothetical protein